MEDVKTVLRILPLLSGAGGLLTLTINGTFSLHTMPTREQAHICVVGLQELYLLNHVSPLDTSLPLHLVSCVL